MTEKKWYVYILRCGDGSLYTGITDDVQRRLEMHRSGNGAKYTRGRSPLELVHEEEWKTKSQPLHRAAEIKSKTRQQKLGLLERKEEE